MDVCVPKRKFSRRLVIGGVVGLLVLGGAALVWSFVPKGLQVEASDTRVATVTRGLFLDETVVRASAAPLSSVILDAVESGRVEEVLARDGALLKQGDLLFRLSNPQRHLELLARQSDHATQISNLSNLRVIFESGRVEHQRRALELKYALSQAERDYRRQQELATKGYVSSAALEAALDKVELTRQALRDEKQSAEIDARTKTAALRQMEQAISSLESGLDLVQANIGALAVRAPVAGRLTDFHLQVGETVQPAQHIGRIDDPDRFKLVAQVDEFYLNRVAAGQAGKVRVDGQSYPVSVSRIFPQIKNGRFTAELTFPENASRKLRPGQSVDAQIELGDAAMAMLLASGPYINDTGGAWVFVVAPDGTSAERRVIRIGRRNNAQVEVLSGLKEGEKVLVSSYASYQHATRLELNR